MSKFAALLLLAPPALLPQSGGEVDPDAEETVVVAPRSERTATHSPAQVVEITGEELVATGARTLPQAIAQAGGVWVQETNLAGGAPFLHGLVGNQVLIVVDGVRLNDATTRSGPNQSLQTIDPAIVERVEVVLGPSSVQYGSDAVGGAVLVWTKRRMPGLLAPGAPLGGMLGTHLVLDSTIDGGTVSLDGSWANETDGVLLIGSRFDASDLETGDGVASFTGFESDAVFGSWVHAFDEDRSLSFTTRFKRDEDAPRTDKLVPGFSDPPTISSEVFNFARQQRESYLLTYDDTSGELGGDRFQGRVSLRRYEEIREEQSTGSDTFSLERDEVTTVGIGGDWSWAVNDDHLLTFGFDVDHDSVDSSDAETDIPSGTTVVGLGDFAQDARYTALGVFLQDEIYAFDPFDVTAGIRLSHFDFSFDGLPGVAGSTDQDGSFSALTASLQVARDVTEDVRVTGTLAQGFRAPNLDELARDQGSFFGGEELANPDLDPEHSLTAQLAVDVTKDTWDAGAHAFFTHIDDVVSRVLVGVEGGENQFARENAGEAALWGLAAQGRARLGDSPYSLDGGATFTRGRQYDLVTDSGDLIDVDFRRVPPVHGRAAVVWEPVETTFGADRGAVELVWALEQDDLHPDDVADSRIDPNGTDGWLVVHLSAGGPLDDAGTSRWNARLINLFDEHYRVHGSGFDGAGLGVVVGLTWRPR